MLASVSAATSAIRRVAMRIVRVEVLQLHTEIKVVSPRKEALNIIYSETTFYTTFWEKSHFCATAIPSHLTCTGQYKVYR